MSDDIINKINISEYQHTIPFPSVPSMGTIDIRESSNSEMDAIFAEYKQKIFQYRENLEAYNQETEEIEQRFKRDCMIQVGLCEVFDDPETSNSDETIFSEKADAFWQEANRGTSNKYTVWKNLVRLVGLFYDNPNYPSNSNSNSNSE